MTPEQKLAGAGLTLPPAHPVVGTFALAVQRGEVLYVSGHGAFADGEPIHRGKLGADLATAEEKEAARAVMLALLRSFHFSQALTVLSSLSPLPRAANL